MPAGRASFEVQVQRSGTWMTEEIREAEVQAKTVMQSLISLGRHEGVRLVKCWERADGTISETVLQTEMLSRDSGRVTIVSIDDAPPCKKIADYYGYNSRATINRLFRKYIEKVFLTPTEMLHSHKAMQRIQEVDTLFVPGVDRVASLQAKAAGEDARARKEEIYKAVDRITMRARKAEENAKLPAIKDDDFDRLLDRLGKLVSPEEVGFYALVALSRDLMERRNWLGKLDRLTKLIVLAHDSRAVDLLDGVLADLLGVPTALQDVLGAQKDLAHALCAIADLIDGKFAAEMSDAREQITALGPRIAEGGLTETKQSLLDRLIRQVAGGQPLCRTDPAQERDSFRAVALRMLRGDGLLGGAEMAEALTRRFVLLQEAGGKKGLQDSVAGVVSTVPDALFRTIYLVSLAESGLAEELAEVIKSALARLVGGADISGLAPAEMPVRDRLMQVTRIFDFIACAQGLNESERKLLCDKLDAALVGFLARGRIIERLDDPAASLRDRATRLLEFCAARLLPPKSKALQLARERVVDLLRQPNFELKFVEGISDAGRREEILRGLHSLLARSGFG
jgi:hypothetical protein